MRIIGYHISDGLIVNSDGEFCKLPPWLNFLAANKGDSIKTLYHLDYSVACLLKMIGLPIELCKELLETSDLRFDVVDGQFTRLEPDDKNPVGFVVQYIPRKWFSIKDCSTRQWAGFSDMLQYHNKALDGQPPEKYAEIAEITGQQVYDALVKLGLHPKSLSSPISAYSKEVLSQIDLPTVDDLPDDVIEFAYNCIKGAWVEAFKLGHFDCTWDWDIKTAYGSQLAKCADFRHGKWERSKIYIANAHYGYCKGVVTIDKPFSPILLNAYSPIGLWEGWLTKAEIDFIDQGELGDYEIEDGWWWIPDRDGVLKTPLAPKIGELYWFKESAEDKITDEVAKRCINGIWGKLGEINPSNKQEKGVYGDLFNPVWYCEVESRVRLKVAEAVLRHNLQDHVLAIKVDGLLTDCTAPLFKNEMGGWKLSHRCPAVVIGSGLETLRDKKSEAQYALKYGWLLDQIKTKPQARQYKIKGYSPVTLPVAIIEDRFEDLGKIEKDAVPVKVNFENKRCYRREPKNGGELLSNQYNSVPWDASVVYRLPEPEEAES